MLQELLNEESLSCGGEGSRGFEPPGATAAKEKESNQYKQCDECLDEECLHSNGEETIESHLMKHWTWLQNAQGKV